MDCMVFPFKILTKDNVLWLWIITTLLAGFFTVFTDLLLGKPVSAVINQGIIVNDTLRMYKNDDIRMYNFNCITDTIVEVITTCNTYTLLTVHLL